MTFLSLTLQYPGGGGEGGDKRSSSIFFVLTDCRATFLCFGNISQKNSFTRDDALKCNYNPNCLPYRLSQHDWFFVNPFPLSNS